MLSVRYIQRRFWLYYWKKITSSYDINIYEEILYLANHYNQIHHIEKIYNSFLVKHSTLNWLSNHNIYYGGNTSDYKLRKHFNLIAYDNDNDNVFIFYIKPSFNNLNYNNILLESIFDTFLIKYCSKIDNIEINEITKIKNTKEKLIQEKKINDFSKFDSKKITTIIFSLDNNEYYPLSWYDENNNDLISNNKDIILNLLNISLINKYKIESKNIYLFYTYWKNFIETEEKIINAKQIIQRIIIIYKDIKSKKNTKYNTELNCIQFILNFFEQIKNDINRCNNDYDKSQILEKYLDRDFFIEEIEKIISDSINEYLGI